MSSGGGVIDKFYYCIGLCCCYRRVLEIDFFVYKFYYVWYGLWFVWVRMWNGYSMLVVGFGIRIYVIFYKFVVKDLKSRIWKEKNK